MSCKCNFGFANTGKSSKQILIKGAVKIFVMRMVADDGTVNGIDEGDVVNQSYLDDKIKEPDETKRWFPIGKLESVDDTRADATTETYTSGNSAVLIQGVRTFLGWLIGCDTKYLDQLESFKCDDIGVLVVDTCKNLYGSLSPDTTKLLPISLFTGSWNPTYVKGSDTLKAKIPLGFEFDQLEEDSNLRVLIDATADWINATGLVDVTALLSGITTTGFVAELSVETAAFPDPLPVEKLSTGDFVLQNLTTAMPIAITSAIESPEGTYTFVIPAQAPSDILELSINSGSYYLKEQILIP